MGEREELLALADSIEAQIKSRDRCAMLGTVEAKMVINALRAPAQCAQQSATDREDLADELELAMLTMQNDDESKPMTLSRSRHAARYEVMGRAVAALRAPEAADAGAVATIGDWTEGAPDDQFITVTAGDLRALIANVATVCASPAADAGIAAPPNEAIDHLGNVLVMLAELHEDDQCRAYENALAYYNAARPEQQVLPAEGYSTRLVLTTPLDAAPPAASADAVREALEAIMPLAEIGLKSEIARFEAMHRPRDFSIAADIGQDRVRKIWRDANAALSAPVAAPVAGADAGMRELAARLRKAADNDGLQELVMVARRIASEIESAITVLERADGCVVWLRDVGDEDDECWVPCAKGDKGATEFTSTDRGSTT